MNNKYKYIFYFTGVCVCVCVSDQNLIYISSIYVKYNMIFYMPKKISGERYERRRSYYYYYLSITQNNVPVVVKNPSRLFLYSFHPWNFIVTFPFHRIPPHRRVSSDHLSSISFRVSHLP